MWMYLLQAADGAGLSHEGAVDAVHPVVHADVRPPDDHVGCHLNFSLL